MNNFLVRTSEKVKKGETLAYAFGGYGDQLIAYFVGSFIMFYLTDYVGIMPAAVGIIMFVPRIWDAINDPIMGIVADRTRTKYGRFRPYLLGAPVALLITTVLLYSIPTGLSYNMKLAWAFVSYFIWGMAYTALAIPNISLVSVITEDPDKRSKIISYNRLAGMIGGGLPMLIVPMITKNFKNQPYVFTYMALGFGFLGMILLVNVFIFCRERVSMPEKRPKILENLKLLTKNKPLLILAIMGILNLLIIWISSSFRIYFLKYNLGDEGLLTVYTIGLLPFNILGITCAPMLIKRLGSVNSYIAGCIARIFFSGAFFMIGNQSIISVILWMGLIDVSMAIEGVSIVNMIIDCVDYGEYRFKTRTEGLYFSIQSFSGKFAGSLSTLITGIALSVVGYVPNVEQSPWTLRGIFVVYAIMPGVAALVSLFMMKLYPLKGKVIADIKRQLQEDRQLRETENPLGGRYEV